MKVTIEFRTDSPPFAGQTDREVARVLNAARSYIKVAHGLGGITMRLRDSEAAEIGHVVVEP